MRLSSKRVVDYSTKTSKEVKNWQYRLSYAEIVKLKDFPQLLLNAFGSDTCILCGHSGIDSGDGGLCFECLRHRSEQDVDAYFYVIGRFKVSRVLKIIDYKRNEEVADKYSEDVRGHDPENIIIPDEL